MDLTPPQEPGLKRLCTGQRTGSSRSRYALARPRAALHNGRLAQPEPALMNLDAWRHYLRARLLRAFKQPEAALAAYRDALSADPGFARAAHALAYLLAALGHNSDAEAAFRRVVELAPRDSTAWFNLGFLYDKSHKTAEAIDAFREAVRLEPKFDRAWYGLGMALAARGDHAGAAQSFERTVQLQPMNPHAWYQLGMAWHTLHDPDKVKGVVEYLHRFDRHMARRLIRDAERPDLVHMVADLQSLHQKP
jgi:tetratricopeptide (TPR) repeat protein